MPSEASLAAGFYYAHKQNRFWQILGALDHGRLPRSIEEKRECLKRLNLGLFDVIAACTREGSLDSAIDNIVPNDIGALVLTLPRLKRIVTNGTLATKLYQKHNSSLKIATAALPSTSSANARWRLDDLIAAYRPVLVG